MLLLLLLLLDLLLLPLLLLLLYLFNHVLIRVRKAPPYNYVVNTYCLERRLCGFSFRTLAEKKYTKVGDGFLVQNQCDMLICMFYCGRLKIFFRNLVSICFRSLLLRYWYLILVSTSKSSAGWEMMAPSLRRLRGGSAEALRRHAEAQQKASIFFWNLVSSCLLVSESVCCS